MYLQNDEIISVLKDYLTDNRYKQAILIDGGWGHGKTFFIKEKVLPTLNQTKENDIPSMYFHATKGYYLKNELKLPRQTYYVSLYDVQSTTEITNKIYLALFEQFFEKRFGAGKSIINKLNLFSKLLDIGLNTLNQTNYLGFKINRKDLPSIKDILKLNDIALILDDIERCKLNINELLGFINNLIEHNNIKVILVANEEEISHISSLDNLPQKYNVSLKMMSNDTNKDNSSTIDIKSLKEKTKELFPSNEFYKKIREKTIGFTIKYEASLQNIFKEVIDKYTTIPEVNTLYLKYQQEIISLFEEYVHFNIRTLIFSIISYEKIFHIINTINFDLKYLNKQKQDILKYTVLISIQLKTNNFKDYWEQYDDDIHLISININKRPILGYKFVDKFLNDRYLDEQYIKNVLLSYMQEQKSTDDELAHKENLSLKKLSNWLDLDTDEEVDKLLKVLKEELKNETYPPTEFKFIIEALISLKTAGFLIDIESYTKYMVQQLKHTTLKHDINIGIYSDNKDFINEYTKLIEPFKEILQEKKENYIQKDFTFLNNEKPWDKSFIEKCTEHKLNFYFYKKFFYYIDVLIFIEKLTNAKLSNINNLLSGIRVVYGFENIQDFFRADIVNIERILSDIKDIPPNKEQKLKMIAINNVSAHLSNYLERLRK